MTEIDSLLDAAAALLGAIDEYNDRLEGVRLFPKRARLRIVRRGES